MPDFNRPMASPNVARCQAQNSQFTGRLILAFALLIGLSACGGGNRGSFSASDVGNLRAINAVSDSPTISFTLENGAFATLPFAQASGFNGIRDGRFDVSASYAGLDGSTVTLLDDERVRVERQEQTTLILAGTVGSVVPVIIQLPDPDVSAGSAEVHVANTASAGTLDVYVTPAGADLGSAQASVQANQTSELFTVTSGASRVRLTLAGSSEVIYDSGAFELVGGERTLVLVHDYFGPGDNPVTAVRVENGLTTGFGNQNLPTSIRIANGISDVGGVDASITVNATTTDFTSVPSNSLSTAQQIDSGSATISVFMETDPGTEYYSASPVLAAGETRTLIVSGSVSNGTTSARLALDLQRPIATLAQVNFINASSSADRLDVFLLDSDDVLADTPPAVVGLTLLANTNLDVLPGTYDVVVSNPGERTELAGPVSITVGASTLYTLMITDADGGGLPPQIVLGSNFGQ